MLYKALTAAAFVALVSAAPAGESPSEAKDSKTTPTAYGDASVITEVVTLYSTPPKVYDTVVITNLDTTVLNGYGQPITKATTTVETKHHHTEAATAEAGHDNTTRRTHETTAHEHTKEHKTDHTKSHGAEPTGSGKNLAASEAAEIAKKMHGEITAIDRYNDLLTDGKGELLKQEEVQHRVVFDFNTAAKIPDSTGGRIAFANDKNFPILTDLGISQAVAFLNPCSMNTPHVHPRASELLTLVKGKTLQNGMMLENGFLADPKTHALTTEIKSELGLYEATVFPQGSIHFQFNPTCEEVVFVAALSSSDPGASHIAQNFFFEDQSIVNATLGEAAHLDGADLDKFRNKLPVNLVQAMDSCLTTCKKQGHNPDTHGGKDGKNGNNGEGANEDGSRGDRGGEAKGGEDKPHTTSHTTAHTTAHTTEHKTEHTTAAITTLETARVIGYDTEPTASPKA